MISLRRFPPLPFRQVAALCLVAATGAGPAFASKRAPAPIVFNDAAPATASRTAQSAKPSSGDDRSTRRVEFRYPDQPDVVYGGAGARQQPDASPMAFSSSQAAISPAQARTYAAARSTAADTPLSRDPALTQGAFDARAAAQQAGFSRQTASVKETALAAMPPQAAPAPSGLTSQQGFEQAGQGIIYGAEYAGLPTANGEILDQAGMTAAHPTLPVPSLVQVSNTDTGAEVVLRINDRGPFEDGPVLQVTQRAADVLGFDGAGRGNLHIRYLGPAPALVSSGGSAFARRPAAPERRAAFEAHLGGETDELFGGSGTAQAAPRVTPKPPNLPLAASRQDQAVYVQLASFADLSNADALMRRIEDRLQAEIVPARVNGADFFRVRVGPIADRETASGLRDQLAMEGIADGRVVSAD